MKTIKELYDFDLHMVHTCTHSLDLDPHLELFLLRQQWNLLILRCTENSFFCKDNKDNYWSRAMQRWYL